MDVVDNVDNGVCDENEEEEEDHDDEDQQIVEPESPPRPVTKGLENYHEGLIGRPWDEWDIPDSISQEELEAERKAVAKKYGFCPIRGMHKNVEPSRIPSQYMYLFGSHPMDDGFRVYQCTYCGHICKSQYMPTHLREDCTEIPVDAFTSEEEEEEGSEEVNHEIESEDPDQLSPVSSVGSGSISDHRSCRSRSNSSSRSVSGRSSNYSRSRSVSRSRSQSRSRSNSRSRSRSSSAEEESISDGEVERSVRSRSTGSSRSRSRSQSRSRSRSRSRSHSRSASSPDEYVEEGEEIDEENKDDCDSVHESEDYHDSPGSPSVSPESYYEILPHINSSPADADLTTKDIKSYPGCQVLSPSNSNSLVPNIHSQIKSEAYELEEEQIHFPLLLGDLNGVSGGVSRFDQVGQAVDPLELESGVASVETPDRSPSSPVFVNMGTPTLPKVTKQKKKKKDEPRKVIPLKDRCFNPEEHCGVTNSDGVPCTRSLTCKTHSMASRRAVPGRSQSFDVLLSSHKKARDEAKAAKAGPIDISDENSVSGGLNTNTTEQKPAVHISWTSPNSVKRTLTCMLRGSAMNGTKTYKGNKTGNKVNSMPTTGGAKRGGKGISKDSNTKLDRSLQLAAGENVLDENGYDEDTVLNPGLYGNQSVLLRNPLDRSDDEINEEDWEWIPLVRVKKLKPEEPDGQPQVQILAPASSNFIDGNRNQMIKSGTTIGFDEARHQTAEIQNSTVVGYDQFNSRKRPPSPSNATASAQHLPVKKLRTDSTLDSAAPQSTLSSLATQLPNPTKSVLGPRSQSVELAITNRKQNLGATAAEVSLKDFPSLQLVSSGSPPISLASLLGIRPQKQDTTMLTPNSFKQGTIGNSTAPQIPVTVPNQVQSQRAVANMVGKMTNITGRSQPRKQQFPNVKPVGTRPVLTQFPGKGSQSVTVKLPMKRGGSSPAICLVSPEQQLQQPQFGHYQLHLPEETGTSGVTGASVVGGTALTQQQQRERNIAVLHQQLQIQLAQAAIKQEAGSEPTRQQQRGTATSSTTQLGEYTLQLPEQNSIPGTGDNSWASLSQERSGQRRLEDAPVADSELSKLLASQFEFED